MDKATLRKFFRKKLYSHKIYKKLSLGVLTYLEQIKLLNNFKKYFQDAKLLNDNYIFAIYYPLYYEINCLLVINWLRDLNLTISLPKINKCSRKLDFYIFNKKSLLIKNHIGILEVTGTKNIIPNVFIIPLIAFDVYGNRLGQGGGYYDYTINELRANNEVKVIGLAYSWQQTSRIYVDPWDIKLDSIVTEKYYKIFKHNNQ